MMKKIIMLFIMMSFLSFSYYDYYGAIAVNLNTGYAGYSYNYRNQYDAERVALRHCGGGCRIIVSYRNSCAAVAWSASTGAYGWYSSRNPRNNNFGAKKYCGYRDCQVVSNVCTSW